jgi:hypothetical protein
MTIQAGPSPSAVRIYRYSPELKPAPDFAVRVNGQDVFVYDTPVGAFARFGLSGQAAVEITCAEPFAQVTVRPASKGIEPQASGASVRFTVDGGAMLSVEFDNRLRRPLLLVADPPEQVSVDRSDPSVRWFEAGKVHDAGILELHDGETIYIEGGAVVRGAIGATGARGVRALGRGLLEGAQFKKHETNMLRFAGCQDVLVDGIGIVNSPSWTVPLYGCSDVTIRNLRIVSGRDNDDGIDVVGSRRVWIEDSLIRTKDDCVALKSVSYHTDAGLGDVHDVIVSGCVLWNAEWGNALEIGFETRCASVSDVTFTDCDVIHCEFEGHYSGGVFTIHNGDRATVSNVRYENIRVEDAQEKLIDFKVLHSHYSRDEQRGQIRDVVLKDIRIMDGRLPPSIIQSYDRDHRVENVTIENLVHAGVPIRTQLDARLIVERAPNVRVVVRPEAV